jgi:hypothetical protein
MKQKQLVFYREWALPKYRYNTKKQAGGLAGMTGTVNALKEQKKNLFIDNIIINCDDEKNRDNNSWCSFAGDGRLQ